MDETTAHPQREEGDATRGNGVCGLFISFEGGDGAGKTTQARKLASWLEERGHDVRWVHEPGGTELGEGVRSLLLESSADAVGARAELLLYEAARAQLVEEVVEPALRCGAIVVTDRFSDSTTAYQGYGRGIDSADVRRFNAFATRGLAPDVTVLLMLDATAGMQRVGARQGSADRMERAGAGFHRRVQEGFARIAEAEAQRVRVVDASGTRDEVFERVRGAVGGALARYEAARGGALS